MIIFVLNDSTWWELIIVDALILLVIKAKGYLIVLADLSYPSDIRLVQQTLILSLINHLPLLVFVVCCIVALVCLPIFRLWFRPLLLLMLVLVLGSLSYLIFGLIRVYHLKCFLLLERLLCLLSHLGILDMQVNQRLSLGIHDGGWWLMSRNWLRLLPSLFYYE